MFFRTIVLFFRHAAFLALAFSILLSCKQETDELNPLTFGAFLAPVGNTGKSCTSCRIYDANNGGADYSPNMGGITGADVLCNTDAAKPAGGGIYKAFIVDGTNRIASVTANAGDGQVDWVLKPNTTYYQDDGTTVIGTTDANGLFIFPLSPVTNVFNIISTAYYTGMNTDWTTHANTCSGWTSSAGTGALSATNLNTNAVLFTGTDICVNPAPIICVEQ